MVMLMFTHQPLQALKFNRFNGRQLIMTALKRFANDPWGWTVFALWIFPTICSAHGFGERYDLPVPMNWVILCSCMVVAISFLWTPFMTQGSSAARHSPLKLDASNPHLQAPSLNTLPQRVGSLVSCALLILVWSCASFGSQDPLMNFAPTFIWITWWLGSSLACLLFGNVWTNLDPWMGIYLFAKKIKDRLHLDHEHMSHRSRSKNFKAWPKFLARWPACATLLIWCALEIVYPIASMPHRLGTCIAFYSLYTWAGLYAFGPTQWRTHADGFGLYFELIAQMRERLIHAFKHQAEMHVSSTPSSPHHDSEPSLSKESNFSSWMTSFESASCRLSTIAFVMAMFSSVLFDGLHAGQSWLMFEKFATHLPLLNNDVNGYMTGALGLILLWALLIGVYLLTCFLSARLVGQVPSYKDFENQLNFDTTRLALSFLSCLLPIAVAYLIAHNFSSFFIQGQNIIALASDPFGWRWDLWGSANYYPDITLIDAKLTWYVASISIVLGHVLSVFMAHQTACALSAQLHELSFQAMLKEPRLAYDITTIKPWVLNIPMTLVMLGLTALSLSIIAEPLTNPTSF